MIRRRSDQGWRAAALAAALFAITLNFLQPLAHAALMRGGASPATWSAMCLPSAPQGDNQHPASAATMHECCLGLAHATTLAQPSTAFVAIVRLPASVRPLETPETLTPVGIRDGPSQPRAPPLPV
ncbi:Protein of unknown function [Rhodospirillales bacterium URHD0017]|nr:Protein of unknown function [Rhodospirillales bacterium URHD0017]